MFEKDKIGQVLEKIKTEGIRPEARWKMNWKNYLFWSVWLAMLFLGAIFFSLIILNFLDLGPELSHLLNFPLGRSMHLLMMTTPFVWLGLVAVALISGLLAFRKTKHGYRYNLLLITSLSVLAVSLLGGALHFSQVNQKIGGRFYQKMPEEERGWAFPMGRRWQLPEDGFLGGRVLEVRQNDFLIESFKKEEWDIIFNEKTSWEGGHFLEKGKMVGIVGEKIGDKEFEADLIREIFPKGEFFHDENRMDEEMRERPMR